MVIGRSGRFAQINNFDYYEKFALLMLLSFVKVHQSKVSTDFISCSVMGLVFNFLGGLTVVAAARIFCSMKFKMVFNDL